MFRVGQKSPGKIKHLNCEIFKEQLQLKSTNKTPYLRNIQRTVTVKVNKKFALSSNSISHFFIVLFHELFLSLEFKNKKVKGKSSIIFCFLMRLNELSHVNLLRFLDICS